MPPDDLDEEQISSFIDYVRRIRRGKVGDALDLDLIVAVRRSGSAANRSVNGQPVRIETEDSLLDGLVDFSDYFAEIRRRVERQPLPDSAVTLKQVYTPNDCVDEKNVVHVNLEDYLRTWLEEPGQRQLAVLGEYGQGNSTTALMTAYHLIESGAIKKKTPVLIELRGKSPRHMTPEDLLAPWAFPYGINPQAVMKLLAAGRVFLILEGLR